MNEVYVYLLNLLRAFVNNEEPRPCDGVNLEELLGLARIHSVIGIVGYMIKKYDIAHSEEVNVFARELCMSTIMLFNKRSVLMEQIIENMNRRGIDHILFKGYIVKDYYPVPELRSYGDIDFVIREKDRKKSDLMMQELGFVRKTDWEPVYSYIKDIEYYEIHTDVMEIDVTDKADYKSYFRHMWEHTVKKNGCSYEFAPEYHFIYLLTHIAKHIYGSGAGIRMYMDIALFIKHFGDSIDWNYIKDELEKLNLYDFCCVTLNAIEEWFGVVPPVEIKKTSEDVIEEFTVFTLEAGIFGRVNRETGVNAVRKENDNAKGTSRFSIVLKRIFPSASTIEKRYTYLEGRHWLLPVAWVHRLFKTSDTWKEHTHEAHVIMSVGDDMINRLNKVHKDIGL